MTRSLALLILLNISLPTPGASVTHRKTSIASPRKASITSASPVAWAFHLKPEASGLKIDPALLTDLEPVLRRALEKGMLIHLPIANDYPSARTAGALGHLIQAMIG